MRLPKILTTLLLALVVAMPLAAAQPSLSNPLLLGLWDWPLGQSAAEEEERNEWLASLDPDGFTMRICVQLTESGNFNPDDTCVLSHSGRSYRESAALARLFGHRLKLVVEPHLNGSRSGTDYHGAEGGRGPWVGDPDRVARMTRQAARFFKREGVVISLGSFGNEIDYAPSVSGNPVDEIYEPWLECNRRFRLELLAEFPNARIVSPGTTGYENRRNDNGNTINHWIAKNSNPGEWVDYIDVHCNGDSDAECLEQVERMRTKYQRRWRNRIGVFEDRDGTAGSRCAERAALLKGRVVAYGCFILYEQSPWGVRTHSKRTTCPYNGVETCDYVWNQANADSLRQACEILGQCDEGPPPPPPPPSRPPGMHQFCALINYIGVQRGLPRYSPETCKSDPTVLQFYDGLIRRLRREFEGLMPERSQRSVAPGDFGELGIDTGFMDH